MSQFDDHGLISRRRALALGGGIAAGGLLSTTFPSAAGATTTTDSAQSVQEQHGHLPVYEMEKILQAEGRVSNGVLSIDIDRDDIGDVAGPMGVTFTPAFEVNGTLTFQPLGNDRAFFNGDLALKSQECYPFIDAIIANGLVFQAFHQHYIELDPQVWNVHFRKIGKPLDLAHAVHNAIKVTGTPLPQSPPSMTTPLNVKRLESILGGSAEVEDGVVVVSVPRKGPIWLGGVKISPELGVAHQIEFKPLSGEVQAAVAPDFSLASSEVEPVIRVMRDKNWFVGCLYNQETAEHPQLYFSHQLKVGDPYQLAWEVRRGLELTAADFT